MHPLKRARLEHALSVTRLSDVANVSVPTIQRAEAGVGISELSAFKLGVALDRDPEEFVELLHYQQGTYQGQPSGAGAKQPA